MAASPQTQALAAQLAAMNPNVGFIQHQNQDLADQLARERDLGAKPIYGGWGQLAAMLAGNAITSSAKRQSDSDLSTALAQSGSGIAQQLHPGDPDAALLYRLDPQAMLDADAGRYKLTDVRQGNTVINAPKAPPATYTAPIYNMDGGVASKITDAGVTNLGQRPTNYMEQIGFGTLGETQQHDAASEAQGWYGLHQGDQNITIARQNAASQALSARAAMAGAGAAQTQAATGQANSPNVGLPPGYRIVP